MPNIATVVLAGLLLLSPAVASAQANPPPFAVPKFHFVVAGAIDYRPAVNVEGNLAIFERTVNKVTKLQIGNLATGVVRQFVDIVGSTRPDWCWDRSRGGRPTTGPVAFSTDDGVWRFNVGAAQPKLLANTKNMIYPTWYPDCQYLAVDVAGVNAQIPGKSNLNAKIDALSGKVVAAPLANDLVWAGFPSVNQVNPSIVAFAGQFKGNAAYYNQDINYTWVINPHITGQEPVAPLDPNAPAGPGFLPEFQARAGSWSPDGKWIAFESNRNCKNITGSIYAIFIQDAAGANPPRQVTSCEYNAQHAKWFLPSSTKTMLIAAVACVLSPNNPCPRGELFHIATLDVTAFVQNR